MPPINFLLGSKTYRQNAKKRSRSRRELIIPFLTDTYELPKEGVPSIVSALRTQGHTQPPSPQNIYHDKNLYREAYRYLDGDENYRSKIELRLAQKRIPMNLFGVECLKEDKITTWEEAVRLAEEWTREEDSRVPEVPVHVPEQKTATAEPVVLEQDTLEQVLTTAFEKLGEAAAAFIESVAGRIQQLERRLATLEASRARDLQVRTDAAQTITERIEAQHAVLQGLPRQTLKKPGGWWEEELRFDVEREFNTFLKRVRNTGVESQLIKAVQILGLYGPHHGSLLTEKMSKRLRGIPKDVEWYFYSRASEDIRWAWLPDEKKIRLLAAWWKQEVE